MWSLLVNALVDGVYVKPPQNVSQFLCGGLNRTGVLCSQCQEGLGTVIFPIQCNVFPALAVVYSDSGRSKPPSKTAGISHYQNPNIYTPEESSQ